MVSEHSESAVVAYSGEPMKNLKPLIAVAACCEKVLIERDGVVSAIRIVDTYYIPSMPANDVPTSMRGGTTAQVSVLISLKSGDVSGSSQLSVSLEKPDGTRAEIGEKWPVVLTGGEQGMNLVINLGLPAQKLGLYWLEVLWNGEPLTKVPIKLVRAPSQSEAVQPSLQ